MGWGQQRIERPPRHDELVAGVVDRLEELVRLARDPIRAAELSSDITLDVVELGGLAAELRRIRDAEASHRRGRR